MDNNRREKEEESIDIDTCPMCNMVYVTLTMTTIIYLAKAKGQIQAIIHSLSFP